MDIDLYKFCGNYVKKPFHWCGYNYATDGAIAIRLKGQIPSSHEFLDSDVNSNIIKTVVGLFDDIGNKKEIKYTPIPEYNRDIKTKECVSCKGTGYNETCPECGGSGDVHWSTDYNDYEDSCITCAGGRRLPETIECDTCGGKGKINVDTVLQIGDHFIKEKKLNMISVLPGIEISEDVNSHKAFYFRFEGGDGLIMSHIKHSI